MLPLLMYAAFAGGMGWSIHKKNWGAAAFFSAMLVWMLIIQIEGIVAAVLMSHSGSLT